MIRPFNPTDAPADILTALAHLRTSRDILRLQAPKAAAAVRRAMKSTEGALRHAYCIRERLKDAQDTTTRKFNRR